MKLDLTKFYQACDPSKTLVVGNAEDRQYYIDFSSVRGGKIITELERAIARYSPDKPTCQLFTGHVGCGKSTELLRLKAELEQQGFHVVYFNSSHDMDMADVDITDILLAIAREVTESLEAIKIKLTSGYFVNLFREIAEILQTPIDVSDVQFSIPGNIAKVTAKTKDSPRLRSQLRYFLEPQTNRLLEAINQEVLEPAIKNLKWQNKKGLVVIVDNLEKLHNSMKPSGSSQAEYLFVDRGEQLKQLNCHLVYTIPLVLIFSNVLGRLTDRFGVDPKVLPMVPIQLKDSSEFSQGITLLQQLVMARAFPGVSWELSRNLITQVFDSPETLEQLCRVSGGHVRTLLMLVQTCLQKTDDLPISDDCLASVIRQRFNTLKNTITDDEWDLLHQVAQEKSLRGEKRYQSLIHSMFVFEYRYQDDLWFDINPILAEARELQ
ncbi:KAP family P-loop domain-containing protein [Nostoc sp. T09]|uniref:ATP-binding protein n=1 Tax=Nostoc sp. T09 TaxID=1932621 RepID=UPI000A361725|nr:ATP-binding protein [Nostoc sp. T09]OUL31313.1 KAP family P-loop domain-containing protein [Nostoc sp. T09]